LPLSFSLSAAPIAWAGIVCLIFGEYRAGGLLIAASWVFAFLVVFLALRAKPARVAGLPGVAARH